jgi:ribosomal-protein-alanine N-acetyltransferase
MKLENAGKTLHIRAVQPDDADWLAQTWSNRAFVSLYCSNIQPTAPDTLRQSLVERQNLPAEALGFVEFIVARPDGERIGIGSLGNYAAQHRRAELMIGIVDPALRRGMAGLEATLLLLDLAFNSYRLNKIFTFVYGYNDYSEANTIKLGFTQEGLLRQHHWQVEEQRFVDLYINGMTLTDFRQAQQLARWSRRLLGRDITLAPAVIRTDEELSLDAATRNGLLTALTVRRPEAPAPR